MDEFITPIQLMQIGRTGGNNDDKTVKTVSGQEGASIFKDIFKSAIEDVVTTDQDLNQAEYLLATGQIDNPAQVTIAGAEAGLAVSMLVQLRNRAQEAYTQLMNINV